MYCALLLHCAAEEQGAGSAEAQAFRILRRVRRQAQEFGVGWPCTQVWIDAIGGRDAIGVDEIT
jgi:hypothetical protein